jgi:hypothetical protein
VVLTLQYTHEDHKYFDQNKCKDERETPFTDQNTKRKLKCEEIAGFCKHPTYGKDIEKFCKKTCGVCQINPPKEIVWQNLDYKNLPGASLNKFPSFNSPVHYRFDWEVWIHTTASMENYEK